MKKMMSELFFMAALCLIYIAALFDDKCAKNNVFNMLKELSQK